MTSVSSDKPGRLSVCMIVRDEEEFLGDCLESLQPICDQLIVVDTGSTDSTVKIAETFGAEVSPFEWCDDFSAARNAALDLAICPWILVVDADETISHRDLDRLRELLSNDPDRAHQFVTRNYTDHVSFHDWVPTREEERADARGVTGWTASVKVRLFPNRPEIRFVGVIHELLEPSIRAAGIPIEPCDIPIHHHGFVVSGERLIRKRALYDRLTVEKAVDAGGNGAIHLEVGLESLIQGKPGEAVAPLAQAVSLRPGDPEAILGLATALKDSGDVSRAETLLRKALDAHGLQPALILALSNLMSEHDEPEEARSILEVAIREGKGDWRLYHNIGILRAQAGMPDAALEAFKRVVELYPGYAQAWLKLVLLTERVEGREAAEKALKRAQAVASVAERPEFIEFAQNRRTHWSLS